MVRILHTADLHLDRPFVKLGDRGKERRRALRGLFQRICQTARDGADLLVIVGDLFEHGYASPDTVNFIKKEIKTLEPMRVFIAPGNHDPCVHDSPYLVEEWPSNVHVFKINEFETVEIQEHNLVIHGIANTAFQDSKRYLKDFRVPQDGRLHVVLFHGSDMQAVPPHYEQDVWFPFDEADIRSCGANYVALGHYHSFRAIPEENAPLACYPGCPEALDVGDLGPKFVLCAGVSEQGNHVEKIELAEYRNEQVTVDCQGMTTREELIAKIKPMALEGNWSKAVVQATLRGEIDSGLDLGGEEIRDTLAESVFFIEIRNETEFPYDLEELADRRDALGELVRCATAKIKDDQLGETEKRTAKLALLLGIDAFLRNEVRQP